jgi:anti-sigma-K factor RskA
MPAPAAVAAIAAHVTITHRFSISMSPAVTILMTHEREINAAVLLDARVEAFR